jgi:hypothetical protein
MFDPDLIRSLQIIALGAAECPDYDAFYRAICRWYSQTFATPLHVVMEELTDIFVLQTYYEESYAISFKEVEGNAALKEQWEQLKARIIDPAKVEQIAEETDKIEEEWAAQMLADIAKEAEKTALKAIQKVSDAMPKDSIKPKIPVRKPNITSKPPILPDNLIVQGEDSLPPTFEE